MLFLLITTVFIASVTSNKNELEYCNGCDIMLGALVPIQHGSNGKCNGSLRDHAIPRVEALLFAIDKQNKKPERGIKVGIRIIDTCGIPNVGTNKAKKFIDIGCQSGSGDDKPKIRGVVGAMYSSVSIDVAKFLQPWHVPLVSPASTSAKLNDTVGFKLFARTVPSDTYQYRVIVDILKRLNWTLITTIVSEEFSEKAFDEMAKTNNICNFRSEKLLTSNQQKDNQFLSAVCHILHDTDSNVTVLLTNDQDTIGILDSIRRVQLSSESSGNCGYVMIFTYLRLISILRFQFN